MVRFEPPTRPNGYIKYFNIKYNLKNEVGAEVRSGFPTATP